MGLSQEQTEHLVNAPFEAASTKDIGVRNQQGLNHLRTNEIKQDHNWVEAVCTDRR
jgi:hypothetical protein